MIQQEEYTCNNGIVLIHTWSDANRFILQKETGNKYAEAYDVPNRYTYKETDEQIEEEQNGES